jgi:hypothetical protein
MADLQGMDEQSVKTEQELVAQIERAFADVAYPGDDGICKGVTDEARRLGTEEANIEAVFRGRHWRDVPVENLSLYSATLSFLTPEAYRFYLPAYMLAVIRLAPEAIKRFPRSGDIEGSLLFSLEPATDHTALQDFVHERIDPLTSEQKAAVREFIHWLYRKRLQDGGEYLDDLLSLLAYWGYPEDHAYPLGRERIDALPPVISGARRAENGEWSVDGENCQLIQHLIGNDFVHVDQRDDGWTKLYQDRTDGAYWELTYPHPEMHGGGPPVLSRLSVEQVRTLYRLPALERH